MPIEKVILAESDENLRRTVAEFVRSKRIDVAEAGTVQDVYGYLGKDEFDLIFIEAKLPECELICLLYTSPSPRDATLSRMAAWG